MELQRQLRMVKKEQAEFERMRAVERQQDTIKNLEKKEYVKILLAGYHATFCRDCQSLVAYSLISPPVRVANCHFSNTDWTGITATPQNRQRARETAQPGQMWVGQ